MSGKFGALSVPVDQPARLELMHPWTGQPLRSAPNGSGEEPVAAYIDLLPATSAVGKLHDRAMLDKNLRRGVRRMSAEELEADQIEKLAKLTKGWQLVGLDGTKIDVDFSVANARELYTMTESDWLVRQCQDFVADLGNFRVAASKT